MPTADPDDRGVGFDSVAGLTGLARLAGWGKHGRRRQPCQPSQPPSAGYGLVTVSPVTVPSVLCPNRIP